MYKTKFKLWKTMIMFTVQDKQKDKSLKRVMHGLPKNGKWVVFLF